MLGIGCVPHIYRILLSNSQVKQKELENALQTIRVTLPFQRRSFVVVPDLGIIPNKVQRHVHKVPPDTAGEQ